MLHYRLFVEVDDDPQDVEKKAMAQLRSWLRTKRLDADALEAGASVALGERASGSLVVSDRKDGSRSLRALISEDNGANGQWKTRLTVDIPGHNRHKPWLWLDLDGPEHILGEIPKLARFLLDVFDARTDAVRQGAAQPVTDTDGVRALVAAVCDPHRRGLILVAASDPNLPFTGWLGLVRELLKDCVGLAGGYVLDPRATEEFNNAVGPVHQVAPWTLRTFRPGVEPDDLADGGRHKVLGRERIINDPVRGIARMLGRRAREAALDTPLPNAAVRVDRIFTRLLDENLLAPLTRSVPTPREHAAEREVSTDSVLTALGRILGDDEITAERVLALGDLAEFGRSARDSREAIGNRLADYEDTLAALNTDRQELRRKLDHTQLEYAVAQEENAAAEAEVRRLRKLLLVSGKADSIWPPDGEQPTEHRPQDCAELAEMLGSCAQVRFTGNPDRLRELDEYDQTGAWAGKIWDVFRVLDDYARIVREGTFDGSVHAYLEHTPPGCHTFSLKKYAADESETVRSNSKFRVLRIFPVPESVSSDEEIFMGAHFKIAQFGMISPRLHYHNDIRGSGLIYVGYVGRHLRNTCTN